MRSSMRAWIGCSVSLNLLTGKVCSRERLPVDWRERMGNARGNEWTSNQGVKKPNRV